MPRPVSDDNINRHSSKLRDNLKQWSIFSHIPEFPVTRNPWKSFGWDYEFQPKHPMWELRLFWYLQEWGWVFAFTVSYLELSSLHTFSHSCCYNIPWITHHIIVLTPVLHLIWKYWDMVHYPLVPVPQYWQLLGIVGVHSYSYGSWTLPFTLSFGTSACNRKHL